MCTYCNQFCPDQLGNFQQVSIARHPEEKGYWIADVSNDEFDRQRWIIDIEIPSPPSQQTVCQAKEGNDAK